MRLPIQLQRAMAAEAEAARESRAKVEIFLSETYKPLDNSVLQVIAAEGEKTASVALRAASDNISGNHAAMQLRSAMFRHTCSKLLLSAGAGICRP